jgi:hypothetical protein
MPSCRGRRRRAREKPTPLPLPFFALRGEPVAGVEGVEVRIERQTRQGGADG